VVGGVAFSGGRGSALGVMAGAFALTVVIDVLFFAGIDPLYQSLFQGLFLVVAVLLGTGTALVLRLRRGAPLPPPISAPPRPATGRPAGAPCAAGGCFPRSPAPSPSWRSARSSIPAWRAGRACG